MLPFFHLAPPVMKNELVKSVLTRRSCSKFLDQTIDAPDLQLILRAGTTANDHGRLQPWEFRVYQGHTRQQLSDAFVRHAVVCGADERQMAKAANAPFQAPTVLCVSTLHRECKIPMRDQTFSAAGACQLMTLMAHLVGYAAIWKTGAWATSEVVKRELSITSDNEIVGFIYLGRPATINNVTRDHPVDRIVNHA